MYGVKIYNSVYSDVKYMFTGDVNTNLFSNYTGSITASFVDVDTSNLKQFKLGSIAENKKVFYRKLKPFAKGSYSFFLGIDQGFSGVRGANTVFLEIRNNDLYIICSNPNDWEFKIFEPCSNIHNLKQGYGINVMNNSGVVTYTSNRKPCMAKGKIKLTDLITNSVRLHRSEERNPKRGSLCYNLFEIDHKQNIIKPNCFVELGITGYAHSKFDRKDYMSAYSLAIDSTGLIKFIPTLGYAWGLYPYRDNSPVTADFKVTGNEILYME